ncbi:glycoside hydrolase family 5 protein [Hyaloscypha variabilis F]|uniref:Glycoside hydrolase family 5 protein n=1 Tax=Hyaloscypha variabilis (strain UAMH 11265 / GT02V1 / F) TaxID=1149755 RepID=A0A2J6RWY3_HYAVF|nr:glycoside hydrolase family 5 protein [Hyaloscypha variabilis F]
MLSKSLAAVFLLAPNAAALIYYTGVAESRGEFGFWSATSTKGTGLPGVFGVDYNLINQLYHHHQKRLRNSGPAQQHAVHDPSQQPMTGTVIGNSSDPTAATTAQFGVFWGELAGRFANNSNLMLANDQAAINATRKAGGHSWMDGTHSSSATIYKVTDPLNNTAFDIYEYRFAPGPSSAASPLASCDSYATDSSNMVANDEYMGWTAWAGGPLWELGLRAVMIIRILGALEPGSLASDGTPDLYTTLWVDQIQKQFPRTLFGLGCRVSLVRCRRMKSLGDEDSGFGLP